ncbi:hypothetical protein HPB48_018310 [Haemaphysalis longicornis]|uniref:ATPase AAA-type core domain-containing protein n=1 Tax=Haemaphysalis longicornis TaxID=44386 RepID=A0A9J6FSL7_HAELO|nr:hypothetical protein HPB48_018310 [Haemaphysalis longicornis]
MHRKAARRRSRRCQEGLCLILETLARMQDSCVRAMEIQKPVESIILPLTHKNKITSLRKNNPGGVLLYGPPGPDKIFMARACAALAKSAFIKLAGPEVVQRSFGDRGKMMSHAFALAKEKAPAIILTTWMPSEASDSTFARCTHDLNRAQKAVCFALERDGGWVTREYYMAAITELRPLCAKDVAATALTPSFALPSFAENNRDGLLKCSLAALD